MYKTVGKFVPAILFFTLLSCGSKKNEEIVAPQGMHTLNLNGYGKPFVIFVPDTVAAKLTIVEQSNGALDIKVGKNFAISINEQAADLNMKRQDLKDDEVNKLKGFIADEPNAIMWESQVVEPEFHFLLNQKIGDSDYSFEEIKDTEANPFSKEAVQKMFDSARNIKEVRKEPKS